MSSCKLEASPNCAENNSSGVSAFNRRIASGYFEHWRRKYSGKPSKPGVIKRINDEALLVHIKTRGKRKFVVATGSKLNLPIAPNLLERNFTPEALNQVWASDIAYIATDEGTLYLADVIDLFSRKVVGCSMRDNMQTSAVTDALRMAWFRGRPLPGLIFHSDRGSQYCSHEFQAALKDYEMKSSMSRKGNCWDNAPTESLWGRLKVGRLYGRKFLTRRQAMDEVIDWLNFYNHKRLHSTLDYVSPMTFEQRWTAAQQQDRKSA